ncbi:pyridoxal phosphate-dependent decarboxylase family protein [Actinomycetospora sp.]|uniref:pyridoxal phosphate-dependent decarboxylase family protein n=1 Tax=Actinomycetospora sp. TaxID=1872135 RepID=UPI002F40014C
MGDETGWNETLDRASSWSRRWLASLGDRPVGVPVDAAEMRARLDDRLPAQGPPPAQVLDELAAALEPGLVASGGPRYFGFVTGGALPVALGADWMVSAADQDAATFVMSPAAAVVEEIAGRWVLDLLGLPDGAAVGFVTGAQMASVACVAAARRALVGAQGWDVERDGLAGAPVPTVVVGEHAHATMIQALRLLGFGSARAVRVPVDVHGRMRADRLREVLATIPGPVLVCAQAGQVNTGASDPFDEIADLVDAREHAWLHVDGAFGLWAAAAPTRRHLVAGVERADSWAVDAHKWLNVPYDAAMAIVRDRGALTEAMTTSAAYLPFGELDPAARTPENSRRARAVPIYAALRTLGRDGVADLVERCCVLARQASEELARHPRVEVLDDVVLNQVLFRPDGLDVADLAAAVQRDGTCWIGTTAWQGRPALRFSVSNWSTTAADVTRATTRITDLVDALSSPASPGAP